MRQLSPRWTARIARRVSDRRIRIAAAALIAAALFETAQVQDAEAAWTPGNPSLPGTYFTDQPIDINGDGYDDFILNASGYGFVTLEALTVAGVNNRIFINLPIGRADAGATASKRSRFGNSTAPFGASSANRGVFIEQALEFTDPDDILTTLAPTISAPDSADLAPFFFNRQFAGVMFHVPAPERGINGAAGLGPDHFGYIEISIGFPGATIFSTGYQPISTVGVDQGTLVTDNLELAPAAPNPARAGTRIRFALPQAGPASLKLFDTQGRLLRVLSNGTHGAGAHQVAWDGRDTGGSIVASGLYFIRLESQGRSRVQRLVVNP